MQASEEKFTKFISDEVTLVIPVYQRNYDWRQIDCDRLFNDISNIIINSKPHFIGTFVYTYDPSVGAPQEYIIIDGQQRITSIILFAKAIYDLTDDADLKEDIRSKFIKHTTGKYIKNKCRLRPTEYDRATFEKLMRDEGFDENNFTIQEKSSAMYRNYIFFRKKITASSQTKEELRDAISQLNIVAIMLKEENPQEIFESLNSTGLTLTKADLIRNFLLMPLAYEVQEELYKDYWLEIEKLLRPSDNVENFLVQYLIAKLKTNDAYAMKASPNTLYVLFKKFFAKECSGVEPCLKDLFRYAKYFHRLLFNDDTKFENLSSLDKKFYELIYLLDAKKSPIILMYLLDRNEQELFDETTFINFVDALISLSFRAKICKRSGITAQFAGNVLARLDKEIYLNTEKFWRALLNSSRVTFPNDEDFQSALIANNLYETIKSDGCKYLLYSLERAARAKELPAYSEATVEHILPQKLTPAWENYLREKNDSQTCEKWLHTLGNLTLTAYNPELSNTDFEAKKKIYEQSNFYYTRALNKYPEWTSKQIQKRAKNLSEAAIKIWILPEEFKSHSVNIDDIFNLDSDFGALIKTKPASVMISDAEIKISAWKSLFCNVLKNLYALDRDIFLRAISIKKNLFMTESKDSRDFKLDENFYVKTVFDTKTCLRITKIIVENFDRLGGTNVKEDIYFTLRR